MPSDANQSPVFEARGLGGKLVYDGETVTLYRDTLTAFLAGLLHIGNDYGTQIISAKSVTAIEFVRQLGFFKKLLPIYFIRFVYPGSGQLNTPSIRAAFAHNAMLMSIFDNRDFFLLREAMLARARNPAPQLTANPPVTGGPSRDPQAGRFSSAIVSFFARLKYGIRAHLRPQMALGAALTLVAGLCGWMLLSAMPGFEHLARMGLQASRLPWSSSIELSWTGQDQASYRTSIPASAANALDIESRNFFAQGPVRAAASFKSEFSPRLDKIADAARSRIVAYGDWTFDWGTSYWLLSDGLLAAAGGGETGDTAVARGEAAIRQKIAQQYKETLFSDAQFEAQLQKGLEQGLAAAEREMRGTCQSIEDMLEDIAKAPVQRLVDGHWVVDPTWTDGGVAMPACHEASEGLRAARMRVQDSTRQIMKDSHVPEIAIARLARPLMTVTIGMVGSATGVTLAAVRLGLPRALLVSPLVTALGVKLAIYATDFVLTSLDEAVNRAPFEAEISAGISKAQAEALRVAHQDIVDTTAAALSVRPR